MKIFRNCQILIILNNNIRNFRNYKIKCVIIVNKDVLLLLLAQMSIDNKYHNYNQNNSNSNKNIEILILTI